MPTSVCRHLCGHPRKNTAEPRAPACCSEFSHVVGFQKLAKPGLVGTQQLHHLAEALEAGRIHVAAHKLHGWSLLLNQLLLRLDALSLFGSQAQGLRETGGDDRGLLRLQFLPSVHDAGSELGAVLCHEDQAVALVQQVLNVGVAVVDELLHCRGSNDAALCKPVGAHFDVVVALFQQLGNLAAAHGQQSALGDDGQRIHYATPSSFLRSATGQARRPLMRSGWMGPSPRMDHSRSVCSARLSWAAASGVGSAERVSCASGVS